MNPYYPEVVARADNHCEYCRAPAEAFNLAFEVEHITPLAAGGGDALDNLALACRSCNLFKGARQQAPDPETGRAAPLFHPRRDVWAEHFAFAADAISFIGLTPTGRATLAALQINNVKQQTARRGWIRLEIFP